MKHYYHYRKTITGIPIDRNGAPIQKLGYRPKKRTKPIKQNKKRWKK